MTASVAEGRRLTAAGEGVLLKEMSRDGLKGAATEQRRPSADPSEHSASVVALLRREAGSD